MPHTDTHLDLTTLPRDQRALFADTVDSHLDDETHAAQIKTGQLTRIAYSEVIVPNAGKWQHGYSHADALDLLSKALIDASDDTWFICAAWELTKAADAEYQARAKQECYA